MSCGLWIELFHSKWLTKILAAQEFQLCNNAWYCELPLFVAIKVINNQYFGKAYPLFPSHYSYSTCHYIQWHSYTSYILFSNVVSRHSKTLIWFCILYIVAFKPLQEKSNGLLSCCPIYASSIKHFFGQRNLSGFSKAIFTKYLVNISDLYTYSSFSLHDRFAMSLIF